MRPDDPTAERVGRCPLCDARLWHVWGHGVLAEGQACADGGPHVTGTYPCCQHCTTDEQAVAGDACEEAPHWRPCDGSGGSCGGGVPVG